ncbi:hypothetical protein ACKI1K_07090, partial [Streptomyces scabiei]
YPAAIMPRTRRSPCSPNRDSLCHNALIRLPPNSTSGAHLDTVFTERGIRTGSDTSVADWDTALLLAELGLGHAVVPAVPGLSKPGDASSLRLMPIPCPRSRRSRRRWTRLRGRRPWQGRLCRRLGFAQPRGPVSGPFPGP